MHFDWWWDREAEEKDCEEPWERFVLLLQGEEAGDVTTSEDADRILREAGLHPEDLRAEVERLTGAIRQHREAMKDGESPTKYDNRLWDILQEE